MDRLIEIRKFIESEMAVTKKLAEASFNNHEYKQGMIAAFSMVKGFVDSAIEQEGQEIAKERGE